MNSQNRIRRNHTAAAHQKQSQPARLTRHVLVNSESVLGDAVWFGVFLHGRRFVYADTAPDGTVKTVRPLGVQEALACAATVMAQAREAGDSTSLTWLPELLDAASRAISTPIA